MTAVSAPRPGWELLAGQVNQRRYEALRAYLFEGASLQQAADATGYTRDALASLVRDLRAGRLTVFAPPGTPGRKSAPRKDAARGRVIELRREGLSVYEISTRLTQEGTPLGRTAVSDILREEGFGRLLRGPAPEASASPATSGRDTRLPAAGRHRLRRPARTRPHHHGRAAAGHPGPGRPRPARPGRRGRLPRHQRRSRPPSWLLSLLALKLTATRRVSATSTTCSPTPPPRCWPGCRSCRRRPRSPTTPTGCRMTTSCGSWPPWTSQMIAGGPGRRRRGDLRPGLPRRHALGP